MKKTRTECFVLFGLMLAFASCDVPNLQPIANRAALRARLSDYAVFQNGSADQPAAGFHQYRLATELFTDYAEKQRLFHLPLGTQLTFDQNGNPVFPDSSILVKTFFYYLDKRNPAAGKRLIETRLLVKVQGSWNAGTYKWNEAQTDAFLLEGGADQNVSWLDAQGTRRSVLYHIPATSDCSACHRSDRSIIPIGPKARNLNIPLPGRQNQLVHFQKMGIMRLAPSDLQTQLPDWKDPAQTLEQRARAYLDVNCAHCHASQGYAQSTRLFLDFELPLPDTRIHARKDHILHRVQATNQNIRMPMLGTTVPDSAGVALIRAYIQSL